MRAALAALMRDGKKVESGEGAMATGCCPDTRQGSHELSRAGRGAAGDRGEDGQNPSEGSEGPIGSLTRRLFHRLRPALTP
jgi:hypothetical protein